MREVLERFDFDNTISKLDEAGLTSALNGGMESKRISYQNLIPQVALQNGFSRHAGLDKLDLPLCLAQIPLGLR